MLSAEIHAQVQFNDVDPMNVVWHGNYPRFLETARTALLDRLGYSYEQMAESGHVWPIVEMTIKYVRAVRFRQKLRVIATLVEYENRLRIDYRILDGDSGELLTKARTTQVAVKAATGELCLESPAALIDCVRNLAS